MPGCSSVTLRDEPPIPGLRRRSGRLRHGSRTNLPSKFPRLRSHEDFYGTLPLLPDAMQIYQAVAHLNPIILTGCPHGGWSEPQKIAWADRHVPGVPIITCMSKEKWLHLKHPGDILVDDYLKYKHLWEQAGGIFVHHTSAQETIRSLADLGVAVRRSDPRG